MKLSFILIAAFGALVTAVAALSKDGSTNVNAADIAGPPPPWCDGKCADYFNQCIKVSPNRQPSNVTDHTAEEKVLAQSPRWVRWARGRMQL